MQAKRKINIHKLAKVPIIQKNKMTEERSNSQNGEPNFGQGTPTISISNLQHSLEISTYVNYFHDYRLCNGLIINDFLARTGNVVVTVNKYLSRPESEEYINVNNNLPAPLMNCFISVKEIFWTFSFLKSLNNNCTE